MHLQGSHLAPELQFLLLGLCPTPHNITQAVQEAGQVVTWISDPMHGNTETVVGYKTRRYDNIRAEIEAFFDVHDAMGSVPGGVHVEMTGACLVACVRAVWGGAGLHVAHCCLRFGCLSGPHHLSWWCGMRRPCWWVRRCHTRTRWAYPVG